jgi:hypothetical protein
VVFACGAGLPARGRLSAGPIFKVHHADSQPHGIGAQERDGAGKPQAPRLAGFVALEFDFAGARNVACS